MINRIHFNTVLGGRGGGRIYFFVFRQIGLTWATQVGELTSYLALKGLKNGQLQNYLL